MDLEIVASPRKVETHVGPGMRQCHICKAVCKTRGFHTHLKACKKALEEDRIYEQLRAEKAQKDTEKSKTKGKRIAHSDAARTPKRPRRAEPERLAATGADAVPAPMFGVAPFEDHGAPHSVPSPVPGQSGLQGQNSPLNDDVFFVSQALTTAETAAAVATTAAAIATTTTAAAAAVATTTTVAGTTAAAVTAIADADTTDTAVPSGRPGGSSTGEQRPDAATSHAPSIGSEALRDDIKVCYHPSSQRPATVHHFEDYRTERGKAFSPPDEENDPWYPFESRLDFEFAEVTQQARMSHGQIDKLLTIIQKITSLESQFTFRSATDVRNAWDKAKILQPTFSMTPISESFEGDSRNYEFHHRSLWEWIIGQVEDPKLGEYFHWDAQRLSINNGQDFVRFYEEPWTSDGFWDAQTNISAVDPNGKPLSIIIWSDKTKLSSHGSQKGHPIIAKIGNLPAALRNGTGLGAGRVVGFLPIVDGNKAERGKKTFVDFKNAIFHKAFEILLEEVKQLSKIGYVVKCGDGLTRRIFPFIHIISADYEELCSLTLIRGLNSRHPCPVCFVPKGVLSNLTNDYSDRTVEHAKKLVEAQYPTKKAKEKALKKYSYRPVVNAFWGILNTNVYLAASFDKLHAHARGLWADHLWSQYKTLVQKLGRRIEAALNERIAAMPPWRGLTHFESATSVEFSDAEKWADLSKIIIFATFNVFTPATTPKGYALLILIRKYLECTIYVSLDVHTEETLRDYERTLLDFHAALEGYIAQCSSDESPKNWDGIIKAHTHIHSPRDIRMKGVNRNMDTKPNEKVNGPLRKNYLWQTNFKKVMQQLAALEDTTQCAAFIRAGIDALDQYVREQQIDPASKKESSFQFGNIYLGSRQRARSLQEIAADEHKASNPAFTPQGFAARISSCVTHIIKEQHAIGQRPGRWSGQAVAITPQHQITECRFVRVDYESKETWRQETDYLHCAEMFHGRPRHDAVIINMDGGATFGQLIFVFLCQVDGHTFPLALVKPLDPVTASGAQRTVDRELALCRLRERTGQARGQDQYIVIPARSIIRGALIVKDSERSGEYIAMDTLDSDMFLRMIELFPNRDMAAHRRIIS